VDAKNQVLGLRTVDWEVREGGPPNKRRKEEKTANPVKLPRR